MPGWDDTSWGYHGDDGEKFHGNSWGNMYVDVKFGKGDFVGCLYDIGKKELSFTKNEALLGE